MTGRLAWKWSHPESHVANSTPMFFRIFMMSGSLSLLVTWQAQLRHSPIHVK